ncbi:MAG: extracellular solute-binding protein [Thermodesulfobacteriota bacterium]
MRYLSKLIIPLLGLLLTACGQPSGPPEKGTVLEAWFHTGRPQERRVMEEQVARFNASQEEVEVRLTLIPEGDYNTQVLAAAAANRLPDILDLDGPYLASYAWQGHLLPLGELLDPQLRADLLPSLLSQGSYNGKLYGLGVYDSGLGLFASRSGLTAVAARLPSSPETAWSAAEFTAILARLAAHDEDRLVLDLRLDYSGEWFTYAFSPLLQSAGGDLIERPAMARASGVLNSPASQEAMTQLQAWLTYTEANIDGNSFINGRTTLSWCGHWEYPRYKKALGDDLLLLPLPDMGQGSRTGMGSWAWAISKNCQKPKQAMTFLHFLLQAEEILAMCEANGAVPGRRMAIALSENYRPGGPLHLFVDQLRFGVPRPQTPAYPVITSAFQQSFQDIRHQGEVAAALDRAAKTIDQEIRDNDGYPARVRP